MARETCLNSPFERVLQTYTVPLAAFEGGGAAPKAEDVRAVRVLIGGEEGGALYVDRLGFVAAP